MTCSLCNYYRKNKECNKEAKHFFVLPDNNIWSLCDDHEIESRHWEYCYRITKEEAICHEVMAS